MTRDAVLERAKRHFDQAEDLIHQVEEALKAGDRAEIIRLQGGEAVARAAAHAALGHGLVALAKVTPPPAKWTGPTDEADIKRCGHGVIAWRGPTSWVHPKDLDRCNYPPD